MITQEGGSPLAWAVCSQEEAAEFQLGHCPQSLLVLCPVLTAAPACPRQKARMCVEAPRPLLLPGA